MRLAVSAGSASTFCPGPSHRGRSSRALRPWWTRSTGLPRLWWGPQAVPSGEPADAGTGPTAREVAHGGVANQQRYRVLEDVLGVTGGVATGSTSSCDGTYAHQPQWPLSAAAGAFHCEQWGQTF